MDTLEIQTPDKNTLHAFGLFCFIGGECYEIALLRDGEQLYGCRPMSVSEGATCGLDCTPALYATHSEAAAVTR